MSFPSLRCSVVMLSSLLAWTGDAAGQTKSLRELECPLCGKVNRMGICGCGSRETSSECARAKTALKEEAQSHGTNSIGGYSIDAINQMSCSHAVVVADLYTDFKTDSELEFDDRLKAMEAERKEQARKARLDEQREELADRKANIERLMEELAAAAKAKENTEDLATAISLLAQAISGEGVEVSPQSFYGGVDPMGKAVENVASVVPTFTPVPGYIQQTLLPQIQSLLGGGHNASAPDNMATSLSPDSLPSGYRYMVQAGAIHAGSRYELRWSPEAGASWVRMSMQTTGRPDISEPSTDEVPDIVIRSIRQTLIESPGGADVIVQPHQGHGSFRWIGGKWEYMVPLMSGQPGESRRTPPVPPTPPFGIDQITRLMLADLQTAADKLHRQLMNLHSLEWILLKAVQTVNTKPDRAK